MITKNIYEPLSNGYLMDVLKKNLLGPNQAIQACKSSYWESSSKILVNMAFEKGQWSIKAGKKYWAGNKEIKVKLLAQAQVEVLRNFSLNIIASIESNSRSKISDMVLIYIHEADRKYSFIGSQECWIFSRTYSELPRLITQKKTTFYCDDLCSGDFCSFVINESVKGEIQLDRMMRDNIKNTDMVDVPMKYLMMAKDMFSVGEDTMNGVTNEELCRTPSPRRTVNNAKLYEFVKVCPRCFAVYDRIRCARMTKKRFTKNDCRNSNTQFRNWFVNRYDKKLKKMSMVNVTMSGKSFGEDHMRKNSVVDEKFELPSFIKKLQDSVN